MQTTAILVFVVALTFSNDFWSEGSKLKPKDKPKKNEPKSIFDNDDGIQYIADLTKDNAVKCDGFDDKIADKVCLNSCSNNYTIGSIGFCIDGWVTCVIGLKVRDENKKDWERHDSLNLNLNCSKMTWNHNDECIKWCYYGCKKDGVPAATTGLFYLDFKPAPLRGCSRGRCRCAPFNDKFRHPIPKPKDTDWL